MVISKTADAIMYGINEKFDCESRSDMWAVYTMDEGFAHSLCADAVKTGLVQLAQRPAGKYNEEGLIPCTFYVSRRARPQMINFLMQKRVFKLSRLNSAVLFNGNSDACGFLSFPASYAFSDEQVKEIQEKERQFSTQSDGGMDNHVVFETIAPTDTPPTDESLYMSMRRQFTAAYPQTRMDGGFNLWILMSLYWPLTSGRSVLDADFQLITKKGAESRIPELNLVYEPQRVFRDTNVLSLCMQTPKGKPCQGGILINVPNYEVLREIAGVQVIWRIRPSNENKVMPPIYQCYRVVNLDFYQPMKAAENNYLLYITDAPSGRYEKLNLQGLRIGSGVTHERFASRQCAFVYNDENDDIRLQPISGMLPSFEDAERVREAFRKDIEKDGYIGEVDCYVSDMSLSAVETDEQLRCSSHGIHAIGPY